MFIIKEIFLIKILVMSFVLGDIGFMDCGCSDNAYVEHVEIAGCVHSPCRIVRGYTYDVYVTPVYLDPRVDSIQLETYIQLYGAYFWLNSTCTNPCGTACPLNYRLQMPRLQFSIQFPRSLHRNPAELRIVAKHKNLGQIHSEICVNVGIDLI